MEVLISIGVIMVGLLGVASVLPLAGYHMAEIVNSDAAAACARAAMRDIKIRNMIAPVQPAVDAANQNLPVWVTYDPNYTATAVSVTTPVPMQNAAGGRLRSVMLDPLGVAQYGYPGRQFPNVSASALSGMVGTSIHMSRVSLRAALPYWYTGGSPLIPTSPPIVPAPMPLGVADRIFSYRDEVSIPLPKDPAERPRQMILASHYSASNTYLDTGGYALPRLPGETPPPSDVFCPAECQIDGNYSWMAMITPAPADLQAPVAQQRTFTVSIIVFYKREFDLNASPPLERAVRATLTGAGYGGGDVALSVPYSGSDPTVLNVRPGRWLLLCGMDNGIPSGTPYNGNMVYRWYRVVAVDGDAVPEPAASPARWVRRVTLAGPDWLVPMQVGTIWQNHWCDKTLPVNTASPQPADTDGDGTAADVVAVLVDGVIGVYTTTVEID